MLVNISILDVPFDYDNKGQVIVGDYPRLKDAMYLTAQPLYKNKEIEFEKLHRIVKSDYRQYSPFMFQNGTKKSENWNNENQNLLILDVDDGLTIQDAKKIFSEYKHLICTTKSHQVEKKGLKCDRFRIILVSDDIPNGDEYFTLTEMLEKKYPFIDKQVNTKTGAFLGFSDCEYWYNEGKLFDCSELLVMAKRLKNATMVEKKEIHVKTFENELPIQEIKNRLTAEIVAEIVNSCGYEVDRNFKFKYRTDERTPSASIRHDGLIKDFGSDLSTDAIGFVQETRQVDFKSAVAYVGDFVGVA